MVNKLGVGGTFFKFVCVCVCVFINGIWGVKMPAE